MEARSRCMTQVCTSAWGHVASIASGSARAPLQAVTAHDQRVFSGLGCVSRSVPTASIWRLRRLRRTIPPARVYSPSTSTPTTHTYRCPQAGAGLTRLRPGCCAFVVICRPASGLGAVLSRQGGCDLIGALLLPCDASMFCKSLFGGGGCLSFLVGWFGVGASFGGLVVGFGVVGRGGGRCIV